MAKPSVAKPSMAVIFMMQTAGCFANKFPQWKYCLIYFYIGKAFPKNPGENASNGDKWCTYWFVDKKLQLLINL